MVSVYLGSRGGPGGPILFVKLSAFRSILEDDMAIEKSARQKSSGKTHSFGRSEPSQARVERARERVKSGYYDLPDVKRALAVLIAELLEKEQ
jgi:hypothetical protein